MSEHCPKCDARIDFGALRWRCDGCRAPLDPSESHSVRVDAETKVLCTACNTMVRALLVQFAEKKQ